MNRRVRTVIVLAIAIVCATVASVGVYVAVGRIPRGAPAEPRVPVVVAAREVPIGNVLTEGDLKVVQWPAKAPVPGAYADPGQLLKRGLKATVVANEPLTDKKVAKPGEGGGLAPVIREGMRAVSVRVNDVIGVAGFIIPGAKVDVVATIRQNSDSMSRIVVANVEVLTAGTLIDEQKATKEGKPVSTTVVTLMATPEDAQRIALASSEGQILLTLRNPLDKEEKRPAAVRTAALMSEVGTARRSASGRGGRNPLPAPSSATAFTVYKIAAGKESKQEVLK